MTPNSTEHSAWLREEKPDIYHLLLALDGDRESVQWLQASSTSLYLFARAMQGEVDAIAALQQGRNVEGEDLAALVGLSNGVADWLREHRPELYLVFEAIKGNNDILDTLHSDRATRAELVMAVRPFYEKARSGSVPVSETARETKGIVEGEAADVSCLVGELHLKQGEFHKAIEAFTRVIEKAPSADAFEGRARAYRALANRDAECARDMT